MPKPQPVTGYMTRWRAERAPKHPIDGAYVKRLRARMGVTQQQLAMQLGCAISTVATWEAGKAKPAIPYRILIRQLCKRWRIDWQSV